MEKKDIITMSGTTILRIAYRKRKSLEKSRLSFLVAFHYLLCKGIYGF